MTPRALTDGFAVRSDLSQRYPSEVGREEILRELDDEAQRRTRAYPRQIASGALTEELATRQQTAWAALLADAHRLAAADARAAGRPHAVDTRPPSSTWNARIRELRRELGMRRTMYPRWVASPAHPLQADEARRRLETVDALHWRLWHLLEGFHGDGVPVHRATPTVALAAHAAARIRARWDGGWAEAEPAGGAIAALTVRLRYHWRVIAECTQRAADGEPIDTLIGPRDRDTLVATARATLDAAVDALSSGDPASDGAILHLQLVIAWLRAPDAADAATQPLPLAA